MRLPACWSTSRRFPLLLALLLLFCIPPSAHADITSGLVGYWSFDDGTGTQATDFSGNGNTGTSVTA